MADKTKKSPDFEAAMQQLEQILDQLEGGEVSLDTSIELYAEAAQLICDGNQKLKNAQVQIQEIDDALAEELAEE